MPLWKTFVLRISAYIHTCIHTLSEGFCILGKWFQFCCNTWGYQIFKLTIWLFPSGFSSQHAGSWGFLCWTIEPAPRVSMKREYREDLHSIKHSLCLFSFSSFYSSDSVYVDLVMEFSASNSSHLVLLQNTIKTGLLGTIHVGANIALISKFLSVFIKLFIYDMASGSGRVDQYLTVSSVAKTGRIYWECDLLRAGKRNNIPERYILDLEALWNVLPD